GHAADRRRYAAAGLLPVAARHARGRRRPGALPGRILGAGGLAGGGGAAGPGARGLARGGRTGLAGEALDDRRHLGLPLQRRAHALERGLQRLRRVRTQRGVADLAPVARLLAVVVPVAAGLA